jgi:hypothetical protein
MKNRSRSNTGSRSMVSASSSQYAMPTDAAAIQGLPSGVM